MCRVPGPEVTRTRPSWTTSIPRSESGRRETEAGGRHRGRPASLPTATSLPGPGCAQCAQVPGPPQQILCEPHAGIAQPRPARKAGKEETASVRPAGSWTAGEKANSGKIVPSTSRGLCTSHRSPPPPPALSGLAPQHICHWKVTSSPSPFLSNPGHLPICSLWP